MSICSNYFNNENLFTQNLQNLEKKMFLKIAANKKSFQANKEQKLLKSKSINSQAIKIIQNYSSQDNFSQYNQKSILNSNKSQQVKFSQKQNLPKQKLKQSFNNYYFQEFQNIQQTKHVKNQQNDQTKSKQSKQALIFSQLLQLQSLTLKLQKYLHQFSIIQEQKQKVKHEQKKIDLIDQLIQTMTKNKKKKLEQLFNKRVQISNQRHQEKQFLKKKLKEVQKLKRQQTQLQNKESSNYKELISLQEKVKNFDLAINSSSKERIQ